MTAQIKKCRAWLLLLLVSCGGSSFDTNTRTFDAKSWAEDDGRREMCGDLCARVLVKGTPRDEVAALLGEPTRSEPSGMHYDVGLYWLDILFDDAGRISEVTFNSW